MSILVQYGNRKLNVEISVEDIFLKRPSDKKIEEMGLLISEYLHVTMNAQVFPKEFPVTQT